MRQLKLLLLPILLFFYPVVALAENPADNTKLTIEKNELQFNGIPYYLMESSLAINGNEVSGYIQTDQLPQPNQSPVADFDLPKNVVAQGETVIYENKSYDNDGQIVETKWEGRQRAFFKPGEYTVSLTVKDNTGIWSEPCKKVINVTDQVIMDMVTYNLHNPIPGEPLDISTIPVLELKLLDPAVSMQRDNMLVSNSPETVVEDGILYSDTLRGKNRLYYHHANGTKEIKSIYLLAINQGIKPVTIKIKHWGASIPNDPMAVGRAAAFNYLNFNGLDRKTLSINPGEKIILNDGLNNQIKTNQAVNGIFDIDTDGNILFSLVAVTNQNPVEDYQKLAVLPQDGKHIRGTFPMANRFLSIQVDGSGPSRMIIADGLVDRFLTGKDKNTSILGHYALQTNNEGNYGVIYRIFVSSKQRVGVIFSPRGGVFAGALSWNRQAFYLPNSGILQPKTGAILGVINPGKREVITFIPPAASFLPVNLIFIPF